MSERVVGGTLESGLPVARKRAMTAQQAAGLAWEAEVLAAARHPGVVELLAVERHDDQTPELVTAYVGTHSIATCGPLPPARAAAVLESLAATVADLHAMGIAHRRIEPTHVLLGAGGRPVLCGFSGASVRNRTGPQTSPIPPEFADPVISPTPAFASATDVFGLGALLAFMIRGGGRCRPPTGHRRLPAALARVKEANRRRALLRLADRAMSPEPGLRPTARTIAERLHDVAPPAPLADATPDPPPPALPPALTGRSVPWSKIVVGAGVVATAVVALSVLTAPGRVEVTSPAAAPATTTTTTAGAAPATTAPEPVPAIVDGNIVAVGDDRYQVGGPGDQVLLGDWDCDGAQTAALFRPSSGDVFVFDAWATPGHALTVRSMARMAGGVRAVADDPDGDGCPMLVVETAAGERVEVDS
jgi:hypothetical protein